MKNNVAIVTGASQGIGRSTALRLARDFSALVLAARNGEALKEVAGAVEQAGAQVLALPPAPSRKSTSWR
jgi:3-oxoacyl-[acyl-carrier protein] reductase